MAKDEVLPPDRPGPKSPGRKKKKEETASPPLFCVKGMGGARIYPHMKLNANGEWEIADPETIKALQNVDLSKLK